MVYTEAQSIISIHGACVGMCVWNGHDEGYFLPMFRGQKRDKLYIGDCVPHSKTILNAHIMRKTSILSSIFLCMSQKKVPILCVRARSSCDCENYIDLLSNSIQEKWEYWEQWGRKIVPGSSSLSLDSEQTLIYFELLNSWCFYFCGMSKCQETAIYKTSIRESILKVCVSSSHQN